jgi:hypothetical protein
MADAKAPKALPYLASLMALVAGLAIAWMDTRPRWDDTGITAGAVALAAALTSASGAKPWLVVLLVAGPLVIAEIGGGIAMLAVAAIAAFGAAVGWGLRRTVVR